MFYPRTCTSVFQITHIVFAKVVDLNNSFLDFEINIYGA